MMMLWKIHWQNKVGMMTKDKNVIDVAVDLMVFGEDMMRLLCLYLY